MVDISTLQVGDKIRVVDKWPEYGGGQNPEGLMDKYLAQVLTVRATDRRGFCLVVEDSDDSPFSGWHWFPELIAEVITEEADEMNDFEPADISEVRAFLGL